MATEDLQSSLNQLLVGQREMFARQDERHHENTQKLDSMAHDLNGVRQVLYPLQERVTHLVGGLKEHGDGMTVIARRLTAAEQMMTALQMQMKLGVWVVGAISGAVGMATGLLIRWALSWLLHTSVNL